MQGPITVNSTEGDDSPNHFTDLNVIIITKKFINGFNVCKLINTIKLTIEELET